MRGSSNFDKSYAWTFSIPWSSVLTGYSLSWIICSNCSASTRISRFEIVMFPTHRRTRPLKCTRPIGLMSSILIAPSRAPRIWLTILAFTGWSKGGPINILSVRCLPKNQPIPSHQFHLADLNDWPRHKYMYNIQVTRSTNWAKEEWNIRGHSATHTSEKIEVYPTPERPDQPQFSCPKGFRLSCGTSNVPRWAILQRARRELQSTSSTSHKSNTRNVILLTNNRFHGNHQTIKAVDNTKYHGDTNAKNTERELQLVHQSNGKLEPTGIVHCATFPEWETVTTHNPPPHLYGWRSARGSGAWSDQVADKAWFGAMDCQSEGQWISLL